MTSRSDDGGEGDDDYDTATPVFRAGRRWHSKDSFLRVGSLSLVSKKDGYETDETDVDRFKLHPGTTQLGMYMSLHFGDANEELRFLWKDSQLDLPSQRDVYQYKLYSAWVSSVQAANGFYFWNYNDGDSKDGSQLIIPTNGNDKYHGLQCEYMEFNFRDKIRTNTVDKLNLNSMATLIMNDVEIGIAPHDDENLDMDKLQLYNPCEYRKCMAVDGRLYCGAWKPWVVYSIVGFVLVLATTIGCVFAYYCSKEVVVQYKRLAMSENEADEEDGEADDDDVEDSPAVEPYRDEFEDEPVGSNSKPEPVVEK